MVLEFLWLEDAVLTLALMSSSGFENPNAERLTAFCQTCTMSACVVSIIPIPGSAAYNSPPKRDLWLTVVAIRPRLFGGCDNLDTPS